MSPALDTMTPGVAPIFGLRADFGVLVSATVALILIAARVYPRVVTQGPPSLHEDPPIAARDEGGDIGKNRRQSEAAGVREVM